MAAALLLGMLLLTFGGCAREAAPSTFVFNAQVEKLPPKLREKVVKLLDEQCGTPAEIKLIGEKKGDRAVLARGADVYTRNCRQCHGTSGDGNGPSAEFMYPRPRDYRPGVFKFTSTTYGSKPLREDLVRTIRRGIRGTSMPSFALMAKEDLDAVVEYVLALTWRGELERQLAESAEVDEEVDESAVPGMIETVLARWKEAQTQVVFPMSPMPEMTAENVELGKAAFLTKGCAQCHGEDGRGQTKENIGVDSWGFPTKAADLTSGMLRGGTEPLDIYRHVSAGINGTPMPSFQGAFQAEPETMWNLTAWVLYLSNRRRTGEIPDAGILKPFPGVKTKVNDATEKPVAQLTR